MRARDDQIDVRALEELAELPDSVSTQQQGLDATALGCALGEFAEIALVAVVSGLCTWTRVRWALQPAASAKAIEAAPSAGSDLS